MVLVLTLRGYYNNNTIEKCKKCSQSLFAWIIQQERSKTKVNYDQSLFEWKIHYFFRIIWGVHIKKYSMLYRSLLLYKDCDHFFFSCPKYNGSGPYSFSILVRVESIKKSESIYSSQKVNPCLRGYY